MKTFKWVLYFVIFLLLLWSGEKLYRKIGLPYPTFGVWKIDVTVTDKELIEIIKDLRKEEPYVGPPLRNYSFARGIKPEYLNFWFYYADTKEIVNFDVRPNVEPGVKTFQMINLYDVNGENRRELNKDLSLWEVWKQIEKFDDRVMKKIEQKIEEKKRIKANTSKTCISE